jgi:hypothetical protein
MLVRDTKLGLAELNKQKQKGQKRRSAEVVVIFVMLLLRGPTGVIYVSALSGPP